MAVPACLGALIPEKIPLISQTENNLPLMINRRSDMRTAVLNWKLQYMPYDKAYCFKKCVAHVRKTMFILE